MTIRASAVLALTVGITASTAAAEERPGRDPKSLYSLKCASCHGRDGTATPMYAKKGTPDLKDADWQAMRTDDEVRKIIAEGSRGTLMRAYKDELSPAEITALVGHLRKLAPPK